MTLLSPADPLAAAVPPIEFLDDGDDAPAALETTRPRSC